MKLRLGTFNLFQFVAPPFSWYIKKDRFTKEEFESKKSWIKQQISQMDCDIIGFQEVFSAHVLEELVKELGFTYFQTTDCAKLENNSVFMSTVVAIASKYPIKELQKIAIDSTKSKNDFQFSRLPIKAHIVLPNQEELWVYVCHLKSNRLNEFEYVFKKTDTLLKKKEVTKNALKNGYSPALKQRLQEATALFFDIKKEKLPVILMCDLNDKEFSITIDALSNKSYYTKEAKKDNLLLYDAYNLLEHKIYNPHPEQKELKRTPTSYYQAHGNVLDYIFVSRAFHPQKKECIAPVTSYEIFDAHLQKNQNGSLLQSDHAQVVCEVLYNK
ncbi:MAG: endonuclease/exonuclease/phosphatase family protein [Candidatus Marinarcus sp.]|uniref:endonuclease/exonuclease/phosphatase family protein n=1 Tax=Candidatus Marinarcus sp. TaxID=3100987 RepID=UPI003B00855C